jgi:uncharacterized coiled-coil protein SlyX
VEAAHNIPWRPLGRLLVEQGLISEDELECSLAEQASTGRPLGETLVELGFVSGPALSRALAAQYGLELITEAGFGTGLRLEIERRHPRGRGVELVSDPQIVQEAPPAAEDLHLGQLEENWARLAAAEERLADTERELTTLRRKLQRRRDQSKRLVKRIRKRDRRIAQLSEIEPDEPTQSVEAAPSHHQVEACRGHLIFAQLVGRYVLLERDDEPPEPGTTIEVGEVGEEMLLVERVGRSPLPDDPRRCAFVQEVFPRRNGN